MSVPLFLLLTTLASFHHTATVPSTTTTSTTISTTTSAEGPHLTTDDGGFLTVIQGFATQLQCVLNTCSSDVVWFKDGEQISRGTQFLNSTQHEKAYKMQHSIEVDYEKGCSGECDDSKPCGEGFSCVDNQCCSCRREEFTLVLRNLTFDESGRYKCQLGNKSELLEFQVEVLESGLKGGFHQNISYDHSECCQQKGISPLCRGMCKPSEMDQYHFDPTSCKTDDYKHFLSCATEEGSRSHVHCCKTQLVPSFCYDFCSGDFKMLRRSHRLCLYYLPEIFSCLDRAYLPFPDPPQEIEVNALEHDKLSICWKAPTVHESNKMFPILEYTVYYKEIPNFPLLGGDMGLPLLTGDYSDIGDIQEDDYQQDEEEAGEEVMRDSEAPTTKVKRSVELSPGATVTFSTSSRGKRSTMVIVTRDDNTNSTTVREFAFKSLNTTATCATLDDLRSATRYIVYVTARNEYGTSVPSVRNIASTNVHTVTNDDVLPDSAKCCSNANVSSFCAEKMCNVAKDPTSLSTITIATTCRAEWPKVSPCIADGRNHTECCLRKGVQHDCLEICAGSTKELGVHSVLCLNLDLQAIYQCIRQGYETHPSAPVNVTLSGLTAHSVTVNWAAPEANSHLVENYTLFIRLNEHGQPVKTVRNVLSPHTENNLDPDSEYVLTIQSHSANGTSLPSTAKLFSTLPTTRPPLCTIGEPIYQNDGRVVTCDNVLNPCPNGFKCTGGRGDLSYCCPHDGRHSSEEFQTCCKEQKMPENCLSACYYNATMLSEECKPNLNTWIQCASEGHDHMRCCLRENVAKPCWNACKHPFQVGDLDTCHKQTSVLSTCFAGAHSQLPAAVRNLEITSVTKDSATLSWEDIEADIILFRVQLFNKTGNLMNSVNSSADIYRFSDLTPDQSYTARVIAINQLGEGPPSWNITFSTKSASVYEADRPQAPVALKVAWNSGPRVNITWKPVTARLNEDPVVKRIEYTTYYLDTESSGSWTTVKTNNTWIVIRDLHENSLYHVYLTAREGDKMSRSSSIITVLAQQDALGLPEPQINIEPDHKDGIYKLGDKLHINCTIPKNLKTHLNIDLAVGPHVVQNDHGSQVVVLDTEADETMDTATCTVTDTDGRQHAAMRHLVLQKQTTVAMKKDKVRVLDDQSVEIECIVQGGGREPKIHFEKDGVRPTRGFSNVKRTEAGYIAKWIMSKVKPKDAGFYKCVVQTEDDPTERIEAQAEVIYQTETLPVNPKLMVQCCEDGGITGDCLQACSIGKTALSPVQNCSQFSKTLLKCAVDSRDHSDCCIASGVSKRCLPLCAGDSVPQNDECDKHAINIMSCFVKSHEHIPTQVSNVKISKNLENGKIHVEWDYPPTQDYKYFAIYYRKKMDDNSEWMTHKTIQQAVDLEIDQSDEYEIGIMAANALGHSSVVYSSVAKSSDENRKGGGSERNGSSGAFWIFVILLISGIVVAAMTVMSKRRELPYPFGKIIRRRNDLNQPTVAFENPAYDSFPGNEVEIRGLGNSANSTSQNATSEWQSANLEANNENSHEYRNGMRYAKLET